jgi:hypothetical protein
MSGWLLAPQLLCAEDAHRFERGSASCGQEAGDDSCAEQNHCHREESGEVEGLDVKQHAPHSAADEVGTHEAQA